MLRRIQDVYHLDLFVWGRPSLDDITVAMKISRVDKSLYMCPSRRLNNSPLCI